MINKRVREVLEGYINHWYKAKDDCGCAICLSQESGTYIDGLKQALTILEE